MRTLILVLAVLAAGCDDGRLQNPVAPSSVRPTVPTVPQVAGTYLGPLELSGSLVPNTVTGSMRMVVVQAGGQVTITGSITFFGETTQLPAFTGVINSTGFVTVTGGGFSGSVSDPDCGTITTTSSTLTFSGRSARIYEAATTDFCGNFTITGTLTR